MPTSISAIIIRQANDKVFVTKRSKDKKYSPGKWETVGGNVESGETLEQALKREIKEELDVDIKSFKPFGEYKWSDEHLTRVFKAFIVELVQEPQPNRYDFAEWGWFSKDEIEKMDFAINCKEKILDYFKIEKT